MPAVLSGYSFQGGRIRGLSKAISPDEPVRKAEGAGTGGGGMSWRVVGTSGVLVLEDSDNAIATTAALTLTVPPAGDVAFAVGTSILLLQDGVGQLTINPGIGVTVDVRTVFLKKMAGNNALATLVLRSTNRWILSGDLEVAP